MADLRRSRRRSRSASSTLEGDHPRQGLGTTHDGCQRAIGGAFSQLPDDEVRHAQRERFEIVLAPLEKPFAVEGEFVHHADDPAIVGRGDPYVAHGLALRSQERLVDTVSAAPSAASGVLFNRSRSFLVPRMISTGGVSRPRRDRPRPDFDRHVDPTVEIRE